MSLFFAFAKNGITHFPEGCRRFAPALRRADALLVEAELDEEGNPVFDGSGKQIFKELSEENRRIAAEELLADLAENGGMDYRKVYSENEADIAAFAKSDKSDYSDGNGALFTLNSNASEELKLQVKAMQACVGAFLDQDGAEYARRFKEKYGMTIDPDEAIVIAQLAISENRSARQKRVTADNAARAVEPIMLIAKSHF